MFSHLPLLNFTLFHHHHSRLALSLLWQAKVHEIHLKETAGRWESIFLLSSFQVHKRNEMLPGCYIQALHKAIWSFM